MSKQYYLSLGSNLGDRAGYLSRALQHMRDRGIVVKAVSKFYETPPWGNTDQGSFLNAVALVEWNGSAEELLKTLLTIEKKEGRERKIHWGPRTLDLDLIYSEEDTCHTDFLTLPHPFFWERAFVLVPMADIAPDFQYQGESIANRIASLSDSEGVKEWKGDGNDSGYGK